MGLLSGFDHDALHGHLAIGDIVSLLPDGRNGIVSSCCTQKTGTSSPGLSVWVEILPDIATVPQNLTDCRFRLVPRLQYAERHALEQLQKRNVKKYADGAAREARIRRQASRADPAVQNDAGELEIARQEESCREEKENNIEEIRQNQGKLLYYGDCIQLQHVASGTTSKISLLQEHFV